MIPSYNHKHPFLATNGSLQGILAPGFQFAVTLVHGGTRGQMCAACLAKRIPEQSTFLLYRFQVFYAVLHLHVFV